MGSLGCPQILISLQVPSLSTPYPISFSWQLAAPLSLYPDLFQINLLPQELASAYFSLHPDQTWYHFASLFHS